MFSWLFAEGRRLWALKGCGLLFDSRISPHRISRQKRWATTKAIIEREAHGIEEKLLLILDHKVEI